MSEIKVFTILKEYYKTSLLKKIHPDFFSSMKDRIELQKECQSVLLYFNNAFKFEASKGDDTVYRVNIHALDYDSPSYYTINYKFYNGDDIGKRVENIYEFYKRIKLEMKSEDVLKIEGYLTKKSVPKTQAKLLDVREEMHNILKTYKPTVKLNLRYSSFEIEEMKAFFSRYPNITFDERLSITAQMIAYESFIRFLQVRDLDFLFKSKVLISDKIGFQFFTDTYVIPFDIKYDEIFEVVKSKL
jgi:hypothetical protein